MTAEKTQIKIGILGFQGDIEEHEAAIASLGHTNSRVKTLQDLENVSHLIIPGGESTVISKFLIKTKLDKAIQKKAQNKTLKIFGTCAGAIILAKEVDSPKPINNLKLIDAKLSRNAYGSQIHSFETKLNFLPTQTKFNAVFIRAPKIISRGHQTKVLVKHQDEIVMLQQDNIFISTFHPELIRPASIHKYFCKKY